DAKLEKQLNPQVNPLMLANPISSDLAAMRSTLLSSLIPCVQYDKTHNKRLPEGLAGSVEGKINNLDDKATSRLETLRFNGEA
ncbi:hypothetical protein, partial [Acinetobacter nosocomialis]|uniref:hypothetical protein n=1 Tax=Acinetobacter nosocomialis TaxID=106654 RepID=UPI00124BDD67